MRIYCGKDYDEASRIAANKNTTQVILNPECVLGLATDSTPVGAYKVLIDKCEKGELDFSKVKSVNLDEYKGLSPENDQSYRYFMNTNLFDHINIDKNNRIQYTKHYQGNNSSADRVINLIFFTQFFLSFHTAPFYHKLFSLTLLLIWLTVITKAIASMTENPKIPLTLSRKAIVMGRKLQLKISHE